MWGETLESVSVIDIDWNCSNYGKPLYKKNKMNEYILHDNCHFSRNEIWHVLKTQRHRFKGSIIILKPQRFSYGSTGKMTATCNQAII